MMNLLASTFPSPELTARFLIGHYLGVFLLALAASLIATPLMRRLALRNRVVDMPDNLRKTHTQPVAYLGGVAIFLGWLVGVSFSFFLQPASAADPQGVLATDKVNFPLSIILGATAVMLTGLIDDVYKILPRIKIGGQFIAAAALSWSVQNLGTRLVQDAADIVGWQIPGTLAYMIGTAFIALLVLGGCNAVNLLDGLDGLAAGVAAIATIGFLFLVTNLAAEGSRPQADAIRMVMCLAILGALLGFLPYNFNPASIFMGDAGSLLVGYLCVSTILLFSRVSALAGPRMVFAGLIIFALPITDTALAIVRRLIRGKPISQPDREHLHHRLHGYFRRYNLPPGLTVKLTVLTIYGLSVFFALLGCSLLYLPTWKVLVALVAAVGGIAAVVFRPPRAPTLTSPIQPIDVNAREVS